MTRAAGRLAIIAWLLLAFVRPIHAQSAPQTPPATPAGQAAAPASGDPWNFPEDEQTVETWGQLVRNQAPDMVFLSAFLALALVGFFRKSPTLHTVTLVASVAYVGFFKSQLITIVNVYGLLSWNLPIFRYSMAIYLFLGFTLISTVLWGRLYCGRICAFGALTQLMDKVVPARLRYNVPTKYDRWASYIKYVLLVVVLIVFFWTGNPLLYYRSVEPFWLFTGHASTLEWAGVGILLVATISIRNLYCRFLCPLGAFLGVLSNLTVFRIKRWAECKTCKICEKTCEWGAIRGPKIVASECVRCDDCERLYMDQKKCPHWLILKKKGGIAYATPVTTN